MIKQILCNNTPLLDVRAPIEFSQGAFPKSTNLPILNDEERHKIGLTYKQQGQDTAIKLGYKLISGNVKQQRIEAWKKYIQQHPNAYLYCFRGGMRSNLVQQWLREEGIDIPLVQGGYKAIRSYLLNILEKPLNLIRISGQTGVGKTDLLVKLTSMINLEGLANHRGSAFGNYIEKQPNQVDFENNLAIEILKNSSTGKQIIIEDESRYIGSINLPTTFIQNMKKSPIVILNCSQQDRINRIYQDYVVNKKNDFLKRYKDKGIELFAESLLSSLEKIKKRLGGILYKDLNNRMQQALNKQSEQLHKQWIADLLENYYDPMYNYQIEKKSQDIIFTGNKYEIQDFLTGINI